MKAPIAATNEPDWIAALLPGVTGTMEVLDGEDVEIAVEPALVVPLPVEPVGVDVDVADAAPPDETTMPPPWDGERPPPDEAMPVVTAASDERDEAPLEMAAPESVVAVEAVEETAVEETAVVGTAESVLDVGAIDEEELFGVVGMVEEDAGADDDDDDATALQERSNNGFKSVPTMPKLGFGTDGSES